MDPKFSVIIPTYNRVATLGRTIVSVLSQTFPTWEIIVVDDGSSDDTQELVKSYPQVIYHYQANSGVCTARNKGAKLATGDWIIFLDSDDELDKDSLKNFKKTVKENPNHLVFHAGYALIDSKSITKKHSKDGNSSFVSGSFLIQRDLFHQIKGYDPNLKFAENTELKFRLDANRVTIYQADFNSFYYHRTANEGSKNLQNMLDSIQLILDKHKDYLSAHVKHLYHQNIGVIEMRFGRFGQARAHLWKSWRFKPQKVSTLIRIAIAYLPLLANLIYKPTVAPR